MRSICKYDSEACRKHARLRSVRNDVNSREIAKTLARLALTISCEASKSSSNCAHPKQKGQQEVDKNDLQIGGTEHGDKMKRKSETWY